MKRETSVPCVNEIKGEEGRKHYLQPALDQTQQQPGVESTEFNVSATNSIGSWVECVVPSLSCLPLSLGSFFFFFFIHFLSVWAQEKMTFLLTCNAFQDTSRYLMFSDNWWVTYIVSFAWLSSKRMKNTLSTTTLICLVSLTSCFSPSDWWWVFFLRLFVTLPQVKM